MRVAAVAAESLLVYESDEEESSEESEAYEDEPEPEADPDPESEPESEPESSALGAVGRAGGGTRGTLE